MDVALDDDIGLAEPEHLETMFDALIDTVSGNESLSLTGAQQYAMSVLGSSGAATRAEMITGVEGFFSAIGDGIQKIWAYIKKMFQGIWNWFFGKKEKGPSITEQTESILKANEASLQAWARTDARNSEEMSKQFKAMAETLDAFRKGGSTSEQHQAEAAKEQLQKALALPAPEQARVIKEVAHVVVKLNSRTRRAIDDLCEQAVASNKQYVDLINTQNWDAFTGTSYEGNYRDFQKWSKEFDGKIDNSAIWAPKGMTRIEDGVQYQHELGAITSTIKSEIGAISTCFKSDVIHKIKNLENVIAKHGNPVNAEQFKKDLTACKLFLSLTTRHIKQLERTLEILQRLSNMIMRLFGLRPSKYA